MRLISRAARVFGLIVSASALAAQGAKAPRRPKLPVGADTNDAHVYYQFAIDKLAKDPEVAADALYWSTRLEPTWADAFYARRIALLLSDTRRLARYWNGERGTVESKEIRQIDSLYYHALTLNPFVSQTLDRQIFETLANDIAQKYGDKGDVSATEIRFAIDQQMSRAPSWQRAWLAYGDGRFADALMLYAQAIKEDSRNAPLHADRGRIFFQMGSLDSALVEMNVAIADLRKRDKKDIIYVYQSKALTEHSIGVIQQRLGHNDLAREAFGRALQEDLSFYPAHQQLAFMSLEARDTTAALTEMELGTQLRSDDPIAHYFYGFTLAVAQKPKEAEVELHKAADLNPEFASTHYMLGRVIEINGRGPDALAAYQAFLARATRTDGRRAEAEGRIAELKVILGLPE